MTEIIENVITDNVENVEEENIKNRRVRIPKQDFLSKKTAVRPFLEKEIVDELRQIFEKFSNTGEVNPHDIKAALRTVSNI
jgi:hypothetical protein